MSVELLGTARENGLKRLLVHHSYKLPLYGRGPAHVFSVCLFVGLVCLQFRVCAFVFACPGAYITACLCACFYVCFCLLVCLFVGLIVWLLGCV